MIPQVNHSELLKKDRKRIMQLNRQSLNSISNAQPATNDFENYRKYD